MFHVEQGNRDAGKLPGVDREAFLSICGHQNVALSGRQIDLMDRYVENLLKWNKKINLISRKDEENIWTRHILHCVSLLFAVCIPNGSRIVDIGTGGGLPGVPIKILRPDLPLLLIDATRKKTEAVLDIINDLGLNEVEVVWGRAETVAMQPEYHRKFDFGIARAVASLPELIEWTEPFLANHSKSELKNGHDMPLKIVPPALLAFKGGDIAGEVRKVERKLKSAAVQVLDLYQDTGLVQNYSEKKLIVVNW
jgi:16S rRNA (guanine527-N7)-methyltransferase